MKPGSIDDGIFGNITEFDAGFIEGVVRSVPFAQRKIRIKERNQRRQLSSLKYFAGEVLGVVAMANLYVGYAYMLYDLFLK